MYICSEGLDFMWNMEKRTISTTITKIIHIYTTKKSMCAVLKKNASKVPGEFQTILYHLWIKDISSLGTAWATVLEKQTVIQSLTICPIYFIYVFIYAQVRPVYTYPTTRTFHTFLEKIHFTVFSVLSLGLKRSLPFSFWPKLRTDLILPTRASCPNHLILLDT